MQSAGSYHGCNFCIRRSALEAVGGFPGPMRFYLEDIEMATRLRAAGFRIGFAKDGIVVHPWRQIPRLLGKINEVHAYRKLLRAHPHLASVHRPWILLKIMIGTTLSFFRSAQSVHGKGFMRGFLRLLIGYYRVIFVGFFAIWYGWGKK